MSLTWLLDNACFDDNLPELKDEITKQDCQYIIGERVPFTHTIKLDKHLPDGPIFVYGSLQFVRSVALQSGTLEGYWERRSIHTMCRLGQFACNYYYPRLSKYLFNQDHAFLPYGELIDKEEWVFSTFGVNNCVFMRPSSGFKEFTGQVYEKKYWKGMIELSNTQIQPEDLVVIARPENIDCEYRVIIGPDGPITSSLTHIQRKLAVSPIQDGEEKCLFNYVNKVLEHIDYQPDPFFVMDIVWNYNNQLSILEVNSMSCSGLYKCDLSKVVGAIKEYFNCLTNI